MEIDEDRIAKAVTAQVADHLIDTDEILDRIRSDVDRRIAALFAERAEAQISDAIDTAVKEGFDREYQRVTRWGEPDGEATTVRKELERIVSGYWNERVNAKTGKPSDSSYSSVSRAEYLMTQICAEDFSASLKQAAMNVTGALKDGLRDKLGAQMDGMLNELFKVKSLQDQGKVEKSW